MSGHGEWQRTLIVMVTLRLATTMSVSIAYPFVPFYVQELGVTKTADIAVWAGALTSVSFLASALFSPLWGALADRVGRKLMVVRSSLAGAVVLILSGLCHNVWQLFALNAIAGIFTGFSAASMALVATQVPEERLGFSLGWLATGQLVGSLVGPLLGGAIADQTPQLSHGLLRRIGNRVGDYTGVHLVHSRALRTGPPAGGRSVDRRSIARTGDGIPRSSRFWRSCSSPS